MKTIICEHLDSSNFCMASGATRAVWLWLYLNRDDDGIVDASPRIVPVRVKVSDAEAQEAFEWLRNNKYRDADAFPILQMGAEFRTVESWPTSAASLGFKISEWTCRCLPPPRIPIPAAVKAAVLSVGLCAYCGATEDLEVDHIKPVSLGGGNERENLQCLCFSCNRTKGNKWIETNGSDHAIVLTAEPPKPEAKKNGKPPLQDLWNEYEDLTNIRTLTGGRLRALQTRMKEAFFRENWKEALAKVAGSAFCTGTNDRKWKADIDWFLKPDTVAKIMEGKYDNRGGEDRPDPDAEPERMQPPCSNWRELAERILGRKVFGDWQSLAKTEHNIRLHIEELA